MDCLAVCTPGLEALLANELTALGMRPGRRIRGGVVFSATTRQLYAANVWLRTASRVLVRAARFRAATFADLEREAARVDWSAWIGPDSRPSFRVTSRASRLFHTGAIAERLMRVTSSGTRASEDDERHEQRVVVRVARDVVTVSIDSSGEHLHRRGWRLATAKAPLRETLAAAMAMASGWEASVPLVDPFGGSGTIAIEAAILATGRAPGADRSFAFERWPSFAPGTWASVRADVQKAEHNASTSDVPPIVVADRDAGAVRMAEENAARARVDRVITVHRAPIAETLASLPEPRGWILTNPPYGTRVGGGDLRDLYATLGRAADWKLGVLAADPALVGHIGVRMTERFRTTNGGLPVTFWTTRVSTRRGVR